MAGRNYLLIQNLWLGYDSFKASHRYPVDEQSVRWFAKIQEGEDQRLDMSLSCMR